MTGMDDFIDVTVTRDGREIAAGRYRLPVTFGRVVQNPIRIGVDPLDESVSRTHAAVELTGGRLRLTDRSMNGTLYNGKMLKNGETADLRDNDGFQIRDYQIRVARAKRDPNIPVLFQARVSIRGRPFKDEIAIGEMMLLCVRIPKGLRLEPVPTGPTTNYQSLVARYRLNAETLFAAIIVIEEQGYFVRLASADDLQITRNRAPIVEEKTRLNSLDVIQIADVRIELHAPGQKSLKCINPKCELLHPHEPHGNCRWCGFKLVGAATILVRPDGAAT